MNLDRKSLTFALIITLAFVLMAPVLLPQWRLMFFSPFLVILFYQKDTLTSLWAALCCGFFIDLLSADARFGLHAVSYCLAATLLHGQRKHFFADSLSTLPIMTFAFSVTATGVQLILIYLFEREALISWQWVVTDLLYMPALDALYAFTGFILPAVCFGKRTRRGGEYFLNNK